MEGSRSVRVNESRTDIESLMRELSDLLGASQVTCDTRDLAGYFRVPADTGRLVAVKPGAREQVQKVMELASRGGLPVRTISDGFLRDSDSGQSGIVLDFSNMREIEGVDGRNLLAHIQRGVTFDQLKAELEARNLKIATPPGRHVIVGALQFREPGAPEEVHIVP